MAKSTMKTHIHDFGFGIFQSASLDSVRRADASHAEKKNAFTIDAAENYCAIYSIRWQSIV